MDLINLFYACLIWLCVGSFILMITDFHISKLPTPQTDSDFKYFAYLFTVFFVIMGPLVICVAIVGIVFIVISNYFTLKNPCGSALQKLANLFSDKQYKRE